MRKKIAWIVVFCLLSSLSFAKNSMPQPLLDKVMFHLTAKKWVKTNTALLTVNVNATLNNMDLVKARSEIINSLNQIAKGEWHITRFERSQDNSGLEKLTVRSQARVDQANLPNVYENTKSISKPGVSYEVGSIEFKPSLEEVQAVKDQLREQLYQLVDEELSRLNTVYSEQNYTVHDLIFTEGGDVSQQNTYQTRETLNAMAMPSAAPDLTVGNELIMSAVVQVASNRKQEK